MESSSVLTAIHEKTLEWLKPYTIFTPIEVGYKVFENNQQEIVYLVIRSKDRVLFYGIDSEPLIFQDKGSTLKACSIFARRGTMSEFMFSSIIECSNEIEALESIHPHSGEEAEDFFARNALWLLNPTVH